MWPDYAEFIAFDRQRRHRTKFALRDCQGGGSEFEPRNPLSPKIPHSHAVCGGFFFWQGGAFGRSIPVRSTIFLLDFALTK
jgi:hypothetical protein